MGRTASCGHGLLGLKFGCFRLEAIAIRLEAIASRLEAIASRLEAIAIRHKEQILNPEAMCICAG